MNKLKVQFDLYKESGKWKYGGISELDPTIPPWEHTKLIRDLEEKQSEVVVGTITSGDFYLVLSMIDDIDYDQFQYHFYQMLFTPSQIKGMFRDD